MRKEPIYYPPCMEAYCSIEDNEVLCNSTINEDGNLPGVTPGFDEWD